MFMRFLRRLRPLALLLPLLPEIGNAAVLTPGPKAQVAAVIDGDTVVLADRSEVRLVGIQAPKLPLGRSGFRAWPLAEEAKAALERLALGKAVTLSFGGAEMDRHGRHLAHLHVVDGAERLWLQGRLLERGMARVYSFPDNRALAAEMLALEAAARAVPRGIWRLDWYRIRMPEETDAEIGTFQLVEGRVLAAAEVRRRVYLNFGEDWRSDFTVSVAPGARRLFREAGMDLLGLQGRLVRVRGWLHSYNGPAIEAAHPEQIEVLQ